jgi:UDP-galactopyranose mutase
MNFKKNYSIVIAKYKEDLSWLNNIDKNEFRIFLYDKSDNSINIHDGIIFKNLPNYGREAHTYLTHIIDNYNNLSELTIFTQAKWNDHHSIKNIVDLFDKPNHFNEHFFYNLNFRLSYYYTELEREKDDLCLGEWLQKYIEKDINYFVEYFGMHFTYGAIFCIKKENILSRSLDFYKGLLNQLEGLSNPEIGHYFERSWYYIFNLHKNDIITNPHILVVGAGLSGIVMAERLATEKNKRVLVIDKRYHIGGNCYDYIDSKTNIRISKYGAHLFHTNSEKVWEYINNFSDWKPYKHKVYGKIKEKIFPIPINIRTINILFDKNIQTKEQMIEYLDSVRDKTIVDPKNSEEYCLSKFGKELYEKVIKDYTKKQWDKYPNELDVSVLKRLPIRYDFSEGYFNDKYQVLPKNGYTEFINNIANNKKICVLYNTDYFHLNFLDKGNLEKIFFTGPIDQFYSKNGLPKLEYRSINFEFELINQNFFQENSVINYPSLEESFTRIVEYKHFYKENTNPNYTIISKEYSTDNGDPYYPVPNEKNKKLYEQYKNMANKETNIIFLGRLASYKYFNMDEAILNSLNLYDEIDYLFEVEPPIKERKNSLYYFFLFIFICLTILIILETINFFINTPFPY